MLYKGAHVLVFDEATSALDEATEASIYRLDRDITLLMIAYRTSTLAGCDRVVRLDRGRIVDIRPPGDGPTPELPRRKVVQTVEAAKAHTFLT